MYILAMKLSAGSFLCLPPTYRACGQVGDLKLVRPNVFRYKLLMLSYLQMFNRFPSAETKVQ
jgi:hypothetical protein